MTTDSQKKILIWLLAALLVVTIAAAALYFTKVVEKPYSAVMLLNGDIYFGKLSYFPKLSITDAYTFQIGASPDDPEQAVTQLVPLTSLSWGPERLVLNKDTIASISLVAPGSRIADLIEGNSGQRVDQGLE